MSGSTIESYVSRAVLGWLLLASSAVGVAPTAAQPTSPQPGPATAPTFSEVLDVRVVNVEVVVTGKKGRRIHGLPRSAFELWVDGEQVPIRYFSEVRDGVAVASPAGPEGSQNEAGDEVPIAVVGEAVPQNLLIFIDEYFSIAPDRDRVLDRLSAQLEQLGERDRVAIVRYDGTLELLTSWTRDRALVADLLQRQKGRKSFGLRRFDLESALLDGDSGIRRGLPRDLRLTLEERAIAQRIVDSVERVVRASSASLRSVAAPPGRRVMLLLAGGWPYSPAEYVAGDSARLLGDTDLIRGDRLLGPLRDTANLLGYTIYPVDVPGLQSTVASSRLGAFGSRGGSGPTRDLRSYGRESTLHQSLFYLAEETGGAALINSNRDQVLSDVVADTRSFYWLGFTPRRRGDDQRHSVEVRIDGPDLEVRSRSDFFDFSRQREVTLAVESALYFDAPPTASALAVQVGRAGRAGLRTIELPVEIGIPADMVTFLPGPTGLTAQLELRIAVLDESGATTDTPVIPIVFEMEERPADGTMLQYETTLKLRRKRHQLVIALMDVPSGTMASSSVEITP